MEYKAMIYLYTDVNGMDRYYSAESTNKGDNLRGVSKDNATLFNMVIANEIAKRENGYIQVTLN